MNNYRKLAVKYLLLDKKRSILTIIGVTVTVMILYAILNLGWSSLLKERELIREETDYELVFLTETMSQIEQIASDDKVKSASVSEYYDYHYEGSVLYENALYVNTTNPYRVLKIRSELESTYGVKSKLNNDLASTYLQSVDGDLLPALILMVLMISFIFAIFGVGIVRNSIQLSTLEQIKDYGNMRCIGATRGQLRNVIYLEGAILEAIGNVIGIALGFVVSYIIGYFLELKVGLHVIAMIPVVVVFFFDLYFAMDENCKVVMNMTPVSAIRGEYRIRKEKIKARRRNLFGKIFGIEGDYAYKNVMRNPGRFMRTVWALGISVAAFIAVAGEVNSILYYEKRAEEVYKYYHVFYEYMLYPYETADELKNHIPPIEMLENISNLEEVTDAKRIYAAGVLMADYDELNAHYTKEFADFHGLEKWNSKLDEMEEPWRTRHILSGSTVECYGYDDTDYARYEEWLVDGTLDVSENGILLVNGGDVPIVMDETIDLSYDTVLQETKYITYTDYQVGDTIDIVDMKKLRELVSLEWKNLDEACEKEIAALPERTEEDEISFLKTPEMKINDEYERLKWDAYARIKQELIEEGSCKSYVIEGILKDDANHMNCLMPRIIMPLEQYYMLTGTDESMVCGMQYHFEKFSCERFWEASRADSIECDYYYESEYSSFRYMIEEFQRVGIGVGFVILFVVLMTTLNIMNTTASNLHLRRKELAQLRVIGVSKKHLMKIVLLEGVLSSIVANMIGITIGILLSRYVFNLIFGILYGVEYHFSILSAIVGMLISTAILCGSVYVGIKDMKQDVVSDLALGGD